MSGAESEERDFQLQWNANSSRQAFRRMNMSGGEREEGKNEWKSGLQM